MAKADKQAMIAQLEEKISSASALLLTEYRGLTVAQMTELRKNLAGTATYSVTKNTLARIAAKNQGIDFLDEELTGPTAIAFVTGEAVDAAKVLRDFAKDNEQLVIRGGVLDGNFLSADEVKKLAELDNRETTLAHRSGAMEGKLVQAASMFKAPASKAVRTVDALREKQEKAA